MEAVTPGDAEAPAKLEGEALLTKVQETLESLLSKKNLVRDQFLAGNMNPQMYIPITVLMAHEKLIAVGATEETVATAATKSAKLGIDDAKSMVRPLLKSKRNVIILRDVPEDTTEEEIRGIFKDGPHAGKIASVKAEVNNAWFVKFNLDEGTTDVVLWLRSQHFKGQPVNASIKSEHFLRSFFPIGSAASVQATDAQMGFPMDRNSMYYMGAGGPPPEAMQEMGFDFGEAMMKGKGKGMMAMGMPAGPQPVGYWQPWGNRSKPPPIILPLTTPATASTDQVYTPVQEEKPNWKDKGAGGWGKGGWQDNAGGWEKGWQDKGAKGGWEKGWQDKGASGWEKGGWDKGKSKGGKSKGKSGDEKGEKGEKGAKGKGKDGKASRSHTSNLGDFFPAAQGEEASGGRKAKGTRAERSSEGRGEGKKWKVREADSTAPAKGSEQEAVPAGPPPPLPPATYSGEYRKYDREEFEKVSKAMTNEELRKPEASEHLGPEVPIFRETPSLELAPPVAAAATEA